MDGLITKGESDNNSFPPHPTPSPSSHSSNGKFSPPPPFIAAAETNGRVKWQNWHRLHSIHPRYYHTPSTTTQIQQIVAFAHSNHHKVRVAGAGHSPSDIVLCSEHIIDLLHYNQVLSVSSSTQLITVQSGVTINQLLKSLIAHQLTLPTFGSIGDQTIGGILGTGTHGTGTECRIMSDNVVSLTLLTSDGRLLPCSPSSNPDLFSACLVNLGCLGIITELTIRAVPAFDLTVDEETRSFNHVIQHLETIIESTSYPRLHWCPHADQVTIHRMHTPDGTSQEERDREAARSSFLYFLLGTSLTSFKPTWEKAMRSMNRFVMYGVYQTLLLIAHYIHSLTPVINSVFNKYMHPFPRCSSTAPAHEQFMFDCLFAQHVSEWAIPRSSTVEALMSLHRLITLHHLHVDFPIEIRFARSDPYLLSPCRDRDTTYIGVISYRPFNHDHPQQHTYFHLVEELMRGMGGRPHWAKPFEVDREGLRKMYGEGMEKFEKIRREVDGEGMFVNEFVERVLRV